MLFGSFEEGALRVRACRPCRLPLLLRARGCDWLSCLQRAGAVFVRTFVPRHAAPNGQRAADSAGDPNPCWGL